MCNILNNVMIDADVECSDCQAETTAERFKGDRVLKCTDCGHILFRDIIETA